MCSGDMKDAIAAAVHWLCEHDSLTCFYAQSLRASLFTGFLTLSGFLFTVKTFLIVRLQQDVYADEDYQKWVLDVAHRLNQDITVYGSLRRLGRWLFYCVCATSLASLFQMTVGLAEMRWSTWLALGAAAIAGAMFARTLFIVRASIRGWVDYLEDKAEKAAKKRAAAKVPAAGS